MIWNLARGRGAEVEKARNEAAARGNVRRDCIVALAAMGLNGAVRRMCDGLLGMRLILWPCVRSIDESARVCRIRFSGGACVSRS